ncbi:MAG: hypothetical protein SAJ12_02450 [Jaaginema sp. PMC 1079.18]|nr:hypothetical protein [Jaaginema sp. PMC 1080.18]MEC4849850.1 hypothetical protein [Jaaginema sp. PMC 1079.18]MEC4865238.1 hypothetical protein [Jaaginema sp. PMC 1078.18]
MTQRRFPSYLSFSTVSFLVLAIALPEAIAFPLSFAQTEIPVEVEEPIEQPIELELPEVEARPEIPELELPEAEEAETEVMEEEEEWEEFVSDAGNFRVALPAAPTEEVTPAETEAGIGKTGAVLLDTNGNTVGYGVFYRDYLDLSLDNSAEIATFLDNFRDDFAVNGVLEGRFLRERDIVIGDYPGREMEFIGAEGFLKTRVYLVGDRLYMLVAVSMTEEDYPEAGDRFLDSFELLN